MLIEHGPERLGGQGLDRNQWESGDRAILALLADTPAKDQVDLITTWRDGAYEVWSRRGMVRFKRIIEAAGRFAFPVIEQVGENPIANQDHRSVATLEQELGAAARSGHPTEDPNRAFIEPEALSHPHA